MKVILLRHGQTDWNVEGRYQGQTGGPLNSTGVEQARMAARALESCPISVVYCSDQERARQTAEIVLERIKAPVLYDSRLREIALGEWEGRLGSELETEYPRHFEERRANPLVSRAPGGESVLDVATRVRSLLSEVRSSGADVVLFVSHAVTLAVMQALIEGEGLEKAYFRHLSNCTPYHCCLSAVLG